MGDADQRRKRGQGGGRCGRSEKGGRVGGRGPFAPGHFSPADPRLLLPSLLFLLISLPPS
eukprot:2491813-Rhodomonas_salina.1